MLRDKELTKITVTEICETAEIDRSTFYAHYKNVDALANAISEKIENKFKEIPHTEGDFAWIFEYVKANTEIFNTYFKLGISKNTGDYKSIYFRNGVYAVVKMWFDGGCVEPPFDIGEIISKEYHKLF